MSYLVFSQSTEPRIDPSVLLVMARQHFRIEVDVLSEEPTATGFRLRLRVTGESPSRTLEVQLVARPRVPADLEAARGAEARGKAGGMSALAERCPTIWEVESSSRDEALVLEVCALLASVALGPVLPSDHSTLFGVRGARERAELKR